MMKTYQQRVRRINDHQYGTTLIEVLITLLVLSIGLLGMAGLQATSLRSNQSAHMRSQANILAYDAIDRLRVNRTAALSTADPAPYVLALDSDPGTPASNCNTGSCSPTQLAAFDLFEWTQTLANELPNGDGAITRATVGGRTIFTVIVRWDDTRGQGALTSMRIETEI